MGVRAPSALTGFRWPQRAGRSPCLTVAKAPPAAAKTPYSSGEPVASFGMSGGEPQPDPTPVDDAGGGPVLHLSKPARVAIALGCGGLAVAHVVWPTLPIDATFLGLLVVAVIGLFFDIERIDALGIHARARARRLAKAAKAIEAVPVPAEPIAQLQPPPVSEQPAIASAVKDTISLLAQPVIHLKPGDLMPPV